MLYIDPDGEWIHIAIAAAIGGTFNVVSNAMSGNLQGGSFLETLGNGVMAFGVGAAAGALATTGPAGWAAGGALLGSVNAQLAGTDPLQGAITGAITGLAGGGIGRYAGPVLDPLTKKIGNHVLRGAANGAFGGLISGGILGGASSAASGGSFWEGAWQGATSGMLFGGLSGAMTQAATARAMGRDPWSGKPLNPAPATVEAKKGLVLEVPGPAGANIKKVDIAGYSGNGQGPVKPAPVKLRGGDFLTSKAITRLPNGSFSVNDWTGYPAGGIKPTGPFRLLKGAEYDAARKLANATNKALRKANPAKFKGLHIHEIHPVKFGGSPTDLSNKIFLKPAEHSRYTTFWNLLMRNINKL